MTTEMQNTLIERLEAYNGLGEEPEVPPAAEAGLRARGYFECWSCDHWYAPKDHYREGICLGCADPCDGSWISSAPPGWWTDPEVVAAHRTADLPVPTPVANALVAMRRKAVE